METEHVAIIDGITTVTTHDNRYKGWQGGIEDMLEYRLNRNLAFHLLLSYRGGVFSSKGYGEALNTPDAYAGHGYQAQLGAAYTFWKKGGK